MESPRRPAAGDRNVIPRANITAWRADAPWADDAQVEQDLVLSRAVIELFASSDLVGKIALRGGTSLHKLFLTPPYRYSEDIDLVQVVPGPIGPVIDAIRASLDSWLGEPRRKRGPNSVALSYRFESEVPPVRPLRLKIEINTREHFALLGTKAVGFVVSNRWFTGNCSVATFEMDELLGTKLRALYQRRKGRDLFDLWLCLEKGMVDPERLVDCFVQYMGRTGDVPTRAQFEQNLANKTRDSTFLSDIRPLLRPGLAYDADKAIDVVRRTLIELLPGGPWQGAKES